MISQITLVNSKIAEFLEWKITDVGNYNYLLPAKLAHNNYSGTLVTDTNLVFHKNWNWLIYAVEKIKSNMFDFSSTETYKKSKELQELNGKDFINFIVEYEPNQGWFFQINMKITNIPIIPRSVHYETHLECMFEACGHFAVTFLLSNIKVASHE